MKVLFAPSNISSFSSMLSQALNKMPDITAKGFSINRNKYWSYTPEWTVIDAVGWRTRPFKRLGQECYKHYKLLQMILWADVIHWQWDIKGLTLFDIHYWLILLLKKPLIIEWVGSELRMPAYLSSFNKYYKKAWDSGEWEYKYESDDVSRERQRRFRRIHALPAACPEMSLYIDRTIFERFYMLYVRVNLEEFRPVYPDADNPRPVIVHTPTALAAKGTKYVRATIESLKNKGYSFDYVEITNCPKEESLRAMLSADIFLDHFIYGSYGMASVEALAMGKPVFSYLMPETAALLPAECPVVSATIETLEQELIRFITDGALRYETGKQSRAYAEKYHDAAKIAATTADLYRAMISKNEAVVDKLTCR